MESRRKQNHRARKYDYRLYFVMAGVFLLVFVIIFRLIDLQFFKRDLYEALASDQQLVYNQIQPDRGRIYVSDKVNGESTLTPIATNKDFALVYAIPDKVVDPAATAETLYEIFDQAATEKAVDEALEADEYFGEIDNGDLSDTAKKERQEFKSVKRDLEIDTRKKEIIAGYTAKLSKAGDPYEPIQNKVDDATLEKLLEKDLPGIDYIMKKHRWYPDGNIGAHIIGFVGNTGDQQQGQYGLEGFFNEELSGKVGTLKTERSANGELIILNDREYRQEVNGSDLVLTIDHSIQYFACNKLNENIERHGSDSGSVIVMDPFSGAILAMCSWPDYDPNEYGAVEDINEFNNPAVFDAYEPGSIFKAFTMAAGLDQGKVTPQTTYMDNGFVYVEGWPKPISNSDYGTVGGHGIVDMVTVLSLSLNTGAIYVEQKIGSENFADYVRRFGFGEKTGIELETEGISDIRSLERKTIRPVEAATASFGQGITATPLQLVTAYSAIANGGLLMKPYLVSQIVAPDGTVSRTQPQVVRRVISEKTSLILSGMLVNVVDFGHAKLAEVQGYYIAGKTGTAQVPDPVNGGYRDDQTIHTFVGYGPVEKPAFVMLVKLNDPKDVSFAASSAAPLFSEIANFIMNYMQVPKER